MNRFSYYITTHFIPRNKDYNSCRNPHPVYQTYPNSIRNWEASYERKRGGGGGKKREEKDKCGKYELQHM